MRRKNTDFDVATGYEKGKIILRDKKRKGVERAIYAALFTPSNSFSFVSFAPLVS